MTRLHVRRARLLGLDAPAKFDVRGVYAVGVDEASADRLMRQRVLASMPVADQIRWLEDFDEAKRRVAEGDARMETPEKLIDGPDRGVIYGGRATRSTLSGSRSATACARISSMRGRSSNPRRPISKTGTST
jgi:hypothetical protein